MKTILNVVGLFLVLAMGACSHVNSVSLTQIPAKRSNVVRAETSTLIFFYLNFSNDYVDELAGKLRAKCPGGRVEGILTKDYATTYFPIIVHSRTVVAEGFCQRGA